jgi:hypothetical protein
VAYGWRRILADDPANARPIVWRLLKGRVTIVPTEKNRWTMSGEGTLSGLFQSAISNRVGVPKKDSTIS